MIELFLSTDGKHTVHVVAQTPEEMATLTPVAKALYQKVLQEFGTKAQMWQSAMNSNGHTNGQANGYSKNNGHAQVSKRLIAVADAPENAIPHCPIHHKPMAFRQGRLGPFWSCPTKGANGRWCQVTMEVTGAGNE